MKHIVLSALLATFTVPAMAQVDDVPAVGDFASMIAPARPLETPPGVYALLAHRANEFLSGAPHRAITAAKVLEYIQQAEACGPPVYLLDIRVPERFAGLGGGSDGHLAGQPRSECPNNVIAENIVFETVAAPENLLRLPTDGRRIIIVCNSGTTASEIVSILVMLGYENTWVLRGGFAAWTPRTAYPVYR